METCFYTLCPQVIVGCKLYQTNSATTVVSDGYYSDGTNCYNVVSGTVITSSSCPTTGGTPYCYTIEIYPSSSYQTSCLGTEYTNNPFNLKLTLYDSDLNPFVANINYVFDIEFDTQLCDNSQTTAVLNVSVNPGQSFGVLQYLESQVVECGFGCVTETFQNPRLINSSLFDCNNVDDISCYKVENILNNIYQETCLTSNPYSVENRSIVITLYDSVGNLATTTRDYIFKINMEEMYCLDIVPNIIVHELVILSGTSSVNYPYIPSRYQDCGQGDCVLESQYYVGIESKPIEYPLLPECIIEPIKATNIFNFGSQNPTWQTAKTSPSATAIVANGTGRLESTFSSSNYNISRMCPIFDTSSLTSLPSSGTISFNVVSNSSSVPLTYHLISSNVVYSANQILGLAEWDNFNGSTNASAIPFASITVLANQTGIITASLDTTELNSMFNNDSYSVYLISTQDKNNTPPSGNPFVPQFSFNNGNGLSGFGDCVLTLS